MTDERTQSTLTWLNSPHRCKQDIATLQDHIKIRQWHRYNWDDVWPIPFVPHSLFWYNVTSLHHKHHISHLSVGVTWRLQFEGNRTISHLPEVGRLHSSHPSWIQWSTQPVTNPRPILMGYPGWMGTMVLLKSFAAFQETDLNLMSAELIFDQPGFGMSFLQRQMQPRQSTSTPDLPTALSSSQIVPSASAWEEWE